MLEVVWRPKAEQDLQAIIEWIWQHNPDRALSFAQEIQTKATSLRESTIQYRAGRQPGTRELVLHPNYLLIYRIKNDAVEILRVKHTKMLK